MLTVRSEIGPSQKPPRDFTEKPPTRPKRRLSGKRGFANRFSFLGRHEHDDEAGMKIDNYFFKFPIKQLNTHGGRPFLK